MDVIIRKIIKLLFVEWILQINEKISLKSANNKQLIKAIKTYENWPSLIDSLTKTPNLIFEFIQIVKLLHMELNEIKYAILKQWLKSAVILVIDIRFYFNHLQTLLICNLMEKDLIKLNMQLTNGDKAGDKTTVGRMS